MKFIPFSKRLPNLERPFLSTDGVDYYRTLYVTRFSINCDSDYPDAGVTTIENPQPKHYFFPEGFYEVASDGDIMKKISPTLWAEFTIEI